MSGIAPSRKVHIRTWGCQMNVYDSDRMADTLAPHGWQPTPDVGEADLIILNTCHIREKATEKLFSELGRLRSLKQARAEAGRETLIAVAGCVAQAEGEEITRRAPVVDFVFGPQSYQRLPEMLRSIATAATPGERVFNDFPVEDKFDALPEEFQSVGAAAFLTVQEGCDKFCSFRVVPYTRGAEYSRPAAAVLQEARRLAAAGAREICLLGQNVNAWHGEAPDAGSWHLGRLLHALAEIPGIERLRYTTSHPRDMTDGLVAAHRDLEVLMPYLHLPVQAGSDSVLRAMNRRHTADDYRRIIDRLRAARPDIALSSDFIVGHPGETDRDFAETLKLVREIGFASAYSFCYSRRPGTPAADAAAQVEEQVKADRLESLQALLNAQQAAFNEASVGHTVPVLFERPGKHPGQLAGRTPHNQALHAEAPARLIGTIVPVQITHGGPNAVRGAVEIRDPGPGHAMQEVA